MNVDKLAVVLFEALQDKEYVAVLRQPITTVEKDTERYYLQISDKRYTISRTFAYDAMKWGVQTITLSKQYKIGNLKISL